MFNVVLKNESFQSFESHINDFLESLDVKDSSKYTYRRQLHVFILWYHAQKRDTLERNDILAYKRHLHDTCMLEALTIGGYLTAVRRYFEWLETMKLYPNVSKGIKGPRRTRGFKKDALSIEVVKKLLSSIDTSTLSGKRDFAIINLMIRTGLRTIEITRALRQDISCQSGNYVLWIHGKARDSKDDFIVLTESTLTPIRAYMQSRTRVRDRDAIFASHSTKNKGKPLTTRSVSRIVKDRLSAIGIIDRRISAHSLRHTAITLSLLGGATPQEARIMARHSDINTTLVYAHNIHRIKQAPERKIDSFLDEL
jgi:integrase/recombinase XerC/integrase/recombinase XerD